MDEEKKIDMKSLEDMKPTKGFGFGIRHVQMLCMCMCMITLFIGRSSLAVAILAMTDKNQNDTTIEIFDWDEKTRGIIMSSFFWGYMTMQIPVGLLAKKYGGKLILLVSLLTNGVLCLALPTLAHYGGWICMCICRVFMGLTQACLYPASHTLLGRWLPASERTALSGFVYGGAQIGTIIAMPLAGIISETALGWKLIYYTISAMMLITAFIWFWLAASTPGEHRMISQEEKDYIEMELNTGHQSKQNRPTPWAAMFRSLPLWAIVVTHFGGTFSYILFFVDLPNYLEKAMQISLRDSALLSAIPYLGMWVGNVVSTSVCEKINNRGLLSALTCRKLFNSIALFGTSAGCIILAFLHPEQKLFAVITSVVTLTFCGFISAGFMVNHLDLSPHFAGVMLSITNFAGSLGSISTPVITSYILGEDSTDISRWRIVFLLTAGIVSASNVFYLFFASTDKQAWDSPDYSEKRRVTMDEIKPLKGLTDEQEKNAKEKEDSKS